MLTTATTLNLASLVDHHARQRPDREAVVMGDRRLTYGQLHTMVTRVASGLRALGVGPGDHVALSCPNVPYFPIAYFGILKLGAIVVPLNVLLKPREIAYHLQDSDAKAYLCFEGTPELPMASWGRQAFDETPGCEHFVVMTVDPAAPAGPDGARTLGALMALGGDAIETAPTSPVDTAVILYTSGTTGQPKGAELTHLNVKLNALIVRQLGASFLEAAADAQNTLLVTLPLFHSFGQVCQMVAGLASGDRLALVPRFEPAAAVATIRRERVNCWSAVPTMFWGLTEYVASTGADVSDLREHLRFCLSGGSAMPVDLMQRFESLFGVRVLEGYGLSETSPAATFTHAERPSKPGTVGQAIVGVEVAVVDDHDRPLPAGQVGEVVIRGHNIMKGYYKRPEATAEALRNGWFHSGDMGVIDGDGYLAIVDRKKDMIIRGGFNVYPREIEEVLITHPGVSLCAVVGVPDDRLGEEVKAYVVRAADATVSEGELLAWCREQFGAHKAPRLVEFRESLPMTATGKILKRMLR